MRRGLRALALGAVVLSACTGAAETAAPSTATITTTLPAVSSTARATTTPAPTPRALRTAQPLPSPSLPTFVLSYERYSDIPAVHGPELLLASDGTLLAAPNWGKALGVRRLTPQGIELLRRAVLDTGLFTETHSIERRVRPDVTPPSLARGFEGVSIIVRTGDRDVRVNTFARDRDDALFVWGPGRDELLALADRLGSLSWLPASAWSDPTERPYVATFYGLYIQMARNVSDPLVTAPVASVWPFTVPPESFGTVVPLDPAAWPTSITARCAIVTADDARTLGEAIAGSTSFNPGLRSTSGKYRWPAGSGDVYLQLEPLLPHVGPTCDGVRYGP